MSDFPKVLYVSREDEGVDGFNYLAGETLEGHVTTAPVEIAEYRLVKSARWRAERVIRKVGKK